jgi:hypothetical protein
VTPTYYTARLQYNDGTSKEFQVVGEKLTAYVRHDKILFEFSHASKIAGHTYLVQHYREFSPARVTEIP